jgi:hypothetical protein
MAIPTGATRVRLKIAPQRGQMLALAEIMPPHAGHLVILVMTLPRFLFYCGATISNNKPLAKFSGSIAPNRAGIDSPPQVTRIILFSGLLLSSW